MKCHRSHLEKQKYDHGHNMQINISFTETLSSIYCILTITGQLFNWKTTDLSTRDIMVSWRLTSAAVMCSHRTVSINRPWFHKPRLNELFFHIMNHCSAWWLAVKPVLFYFSTTSLHHQGWIFPSFPRCFNSALCDVVFNSARRHSVITVWSLYGKPRNVL